jgi:hypothetical protein
MNTILGKTKLLQGCSGSDLDLGGNDVDARDLLGDGVLDLDAGVDLDEVVAVLLVNQELGGSRVACFTLLVALFLSSGGGVERGFEKVVVCKG